MVLESSDCVDLHNMGATVQGQCAMVIVSDGVTQQ
jgi:hypothetical protein